DQFLQGWDGRALTEHRLHKGKRDRRRPALDSYADPDGSRRGTHGYAQLGIKTQRAQRLLRSTPSDSTSAMAHSQRGLALPQLAGLFYPDPQTTTSSPPIGRGDECPTLTPTQPA